MKSLSEVKNQILNDKILSDVLNISKGSKIFLVGGYLRDLFMGRKSFDRDIVTIGPSKDIAKDLASMLDGTFIELDSKYEIYRVVLKDKINYLDISRALDDDLLSDAKRRDFTINSIFFDFCCEKFYDPLRGIDDIEKRVIKTADTKNLQDDPLRMLRAFRFQSALGFDIDDSVLSFVKVNASSINNCAFERINQELIKLFEGEYYADTLINADKSNLVDKILPFVKDIKKIPKNSHHHLDLFHHSIETARQIRLDNAILKFAAFCHDIGKPATFTIDETGRHRFIGHDEKGSKLILPHMSKLKFSKKQIEYVSMMIKYHIYPSALMCDNEVSHKAMIRFIRKLEPYVEDIIELARADRLSARGAQVSNEMIENNLSNLEKLLDYYHKIKPSLEEIPKLVCGNEIMEILNIGPSKELGIIIDMLKEAQIEGIVKTKEEAVEFVKKCNK